MSQAGCSVNEVYRLLRHFPAPGMGDTPVPVTTNQITPMAFPPFQVNPIRHELLSGDFTVVNHTTPDHDLHPGYVRRIVQTCGDAVYLRTLGVGVGGSAGLTELLSGAVWTRVDANVTARLCNSNEPSCRDFGFR